MPCRLDTEDSVEVSVTVGPLASYTTRASAACALGLVAKSAAAPAGRFTVTAQPPEALHADGVTTKVKSVPYSRPTRLDAAPLVTTKSSTVSPDTPSEKTSSNGMGLVRATAPAEVLSVGFGGSLSKRKLSTSDSTLGLPATSFAARAGIRTNTGPSPLGATKTVNLSARSSYSISVTAPPPDTLKSTKVRATVTVRLVLLEWVTLEKAVPLK
mmetsp:Transcript_28573/g.54578  ORF Transcript_28573/g.54578 Transcript_28573/m.54578 type:complete len:213 (-) Transcript_28573:723-1361(-)